MKEIQLPEYERLESDLQELSNICDPDLPGWSRPTFSEYEKEGREWVIKAMQKEGLSVRTDYLGNVIGTLKGHGSKKKAIVIGSHTDTVEGGGRFDGIVGVLGALEVVRILKESNITLSHDLRVVDYYNEEPNRFGLSCLGSRALSSNLLKEHLNLKDEYGMTLFEALENDGLRPDLVDQVAWSSDEILASLELHIEQGPYLEAEKTSIGVVTSIAGIARLKASFKGRRDHAGTMPMNLRMDAGCAAASTVLAIERIAAAGAGSVGTVGEVRFTPEATNVVTELAVLNAEFRSPEHEWFMRAKEELVQAIEEASQLRNVLGELDWLPPEPPTQMNVKVSSRIEAATAFLGHNAMQLYSGAGHDSVQMARLGPTGMIFIPSKDGRSHCPEEWTDIQDIVNGVHVLAQAVLEVDTKGV